MEAIHIIKEEGGGFNVVQGNRSSETVSFDEMLGLVASLTMPEKIPCLQWMKTEEERERLKDICLIRATTKLITKNETKSNSHRQPR